FVSVQLCQDGSKEKSCVVIPGRNASCLREPMGRRVHSGRGVVHESEVEQSGKKIGRPVDRFAPERFRLVEAFLQRELLSPFRYGGGILHRQQEHGDVRQRHFTSGRIRTCALDSTNNTSLPASAPGNCSTRPLGQRTVNFSTRSALPSPKCSRESLCEI